MRVFNKYFRGHGQYQSITHSSLEENTVDQSDSVIYMKNAFLHYGKGHSQVPVLLGMDMKINRGSIYGLIGPSGCGKTTLIHCILGKKKLTSGQLLVFGSRYCGIHESRVGYMPQELALVSELTIKETLQYFGMIFKISKERIESRSELLIDLLELPDKNRLIVTLSGGQQRRVSLAAALFHEPELLILDEPTVGVDPILRKGIWSHLVEIIRTSNFQTTIIITTHYIEETRQASTIGMMRCGRMLAEGTPPELLQTYQMPTLEEVFTHLCHGNLNTKQDQDSLPAGDTQEKLELCCLPGNDNNTANVKETMRNSKPFQALLSNTGVCSYSKWHCLRWHVIIAVLITNVIRIRRKMVSFIALSVLPAFLFSTCHICVGHNLTGMTLAVFNEDISTVSCQHYRSGCIVNGSSNTDAGERANLSCRYLSHLDLNVISPVFYDNLPDAKRAARAGRHHGIVHFKENYTNALVKRYITRTWGNDEDEIDQGDIHVTLEMSNQVMTTFIQAQLIQAYQLFSLDLFAACQIRAKVAAIPINYGDSINGSSQLTFTDFVMPGITVTLIYFTVCSYAGMAFVIDKKMGVMERRWATGVTPAEVVMAYFVTYISIAVVQVILVMITMIVVFQDHVEGSITCYILLLLLQGICGVSLGLVISASFDSEFEAIVVGISSMLVNLSLGGIMWPLEGMPEVFRYFSYMLPSTLTTEALRGIASRGWGFDYMQVCVAFLVTIGWILFLLVSSIVITRIRT